MYVPTLHWPKETWHLCAWTRVTFVPASEGVSGRGVGGCSRGLWSELILYIHIYVVTTVQYKIDLNFIYKKAILPKVVRSTTRTTGTC